MKYLYRYKMSERCGENINTGAIECDFFVPSFEWYTLPGEKVMFKTLLVRIMFWMMTFGKMKIFYVHNGDELVHTFYVIPKCFKFSFMEKDDYEIDPCFTYPKYRGQGIYPDVLRTICRCEGKESTVFYMIVDESNIASIKGIEKAGFVRCGSVNVSKLFKRYYFIEEDAC